MSLTVHPLQRAVYISQKQPQKHSEKSSQTASAERCWESMMTIIKEKIPALIGYFAVANLPLPYFNIQHTVMK